MGPLETSLRYDTTQKSEEYVQLNFYFCYVNTNSVSVFRCSFLDLKPLLFVPHRPLFRIVSKLIVTYKTVYLLYMAV
jgi:hypothetical protein